MFSFSFRPQVQETPKKNVRKRVPKPESWGCNKRQKLHQAGKMYRSRRGKQVPEKAIQTKKNCISNCKYGCASKISEDERNDIFLSFYSLPSATEKRHFFINSTIRTTTARPKRKEVQHNDESDIANEETDGANDDEDQTVSKRKYSYKFFFHVKGEKVRVCKTFYLTTLSISQKSVYTAHNTKNVKTNTPRPDMRGKAMNSKRKPKGDADAARDHIKSFPKIESHYCRASTDREYLESHLNVAKMYDLYKSKCNSEDIEPVKKSLYYHIFSTEFNLGFHEPKKDRCDLCEKFKVAEKTETLSETLKADFERHQVFKQEMRNVRAEEKQQQNVPVLLFDLQNVILTPHAEISSLFYLRKLSVYNLTAYYTTTKKVYCALWTEAMAGRAGNDIASAFRKILDVVVEENDVTDLVTWSDSCVPQNRNSIISNAVLHFMRENPTVNSITMKYSLPGHSCVQEVDHAHSQIEKLMRKAEFYSPIGLIRILKQVNRSNPYRVIQMRPHDFKEYSTTAKLFNYKLIPFTQVSVLSFSQTSHIVQYKTSHDRYEPMNCVNVKFNETPKRKRTIEGPASTSSVFNVKPKVQACTKDVPELKKMDIKAAFQFMPLQDREYYRAVLKI